MVTIKITDNMKVAINEFVGKEVLNGPQEITAELKLNPGDQRPHIVFQHQSEDGETESLLLNKYDINFTTKFFRPFGGWEFHYYGSFSAFEDKASSSFPFMLESFKSTGNEGIHVSQKKAIIVIGALFGFSEAGIEDPTFAQVKGAETLKSMF